VFWPMVGATRPAAALVHQCACSQISPSVLRDEFLLMGECRVASVEVLQENALCWRDGYPLPVVPLGVLDHVAVPRTLTHVVRDSVLVKIDVCVVFAHMFQIRQFFTAMVM
jgi:hypothetical protein